MSKLGDEVKLALAGWVRMATNPIESFPFAALEGRNEFAIATTYAHLAKVVRQHNCPFAPAIQKSNTAYLHLDTTNTKDVRLMVLIAVLEMARKFFEISPSETHKNQPVDLSALFWVFNEISPDVASSKEFGEAFTNARRLYSAVALASGLTLADIGPTHPDPEGDGRNVTTFPTLIMHRLHIEDRGFMQTSVANELFNRFFPVIT